MQIFTKICYKKSTVNSARWVKFSQIHRAFTLTLIHHPIIAYSHEISQLFIMTRKINFKLNFFRLKRKLSFGEKFPTMKWENFSCLNHVVSLSPIERNHFRTYNIAFLGFFSWLSFHHPHSLLPIFSLNLMCIHK